MKRDDPKNKSSQEEQNAEHCHESGNILSIIGKIARRNAPERIYICRAEVKRDRNDEGGQR